MPHGRFGAFAREHVGRRQGRCMSGGCNIAVADVMPECVRVQVFALKKVQGEEYKF